MNTKAVNSVRRNTERGRERGGRPDDAVVGARLLVRTRSEIHVVPVPEIRWIEAADDDVVLHCVGGRLRARRTLRSLLSCLEAAAFVRVSRSAAVNLAHVQKLSLLYVGEYTVILQGGVTVRATRRGLGDLRRRIERVSLGP